MGKFEQIANADLKLRTVIVASGLAFSTVFSTFALGSQSNVGMQLGFLLGLVAAVTTSFFVVKKLP